MIFKKSVLLVSALLVTLAFAGCAKKPRRPNPLDTVTGPVGSAGSGDRMGGFSPEMVGGDGAEFGLESRAETGDWAERARRGVLPTVLFAFDSSAIAPQERSKVDDAARYLQENSQAKLLMEGHCDWRGTAEYNLALGDRRARSVQAYLEGLGIDPSRLQTISQGDLQATEGASSAQMAQERRVELLVVDN